MHMLNILKHEFVHLIVFREKNPSKKIQILDLYSHSQLGSVYKHGPAS